MGPAYDPGLLFKFIGIQTGVQWLVILSVKETGGKVGGSVEARQGLELVNRGSKCALVQSRHVTYTYSTMYSSKHHKPFYFHVTDFQEDQ